MRRSSGGNRFIESDSTRPNLLGAIERGLDDLEAWAKDTGREVDYGAISINAERIPSGRISVSVTGDLRKTDR